MTKLANTETVAIINRSAFFKISGGTPPTPQLVYRRLTAYDHKNDDGNDGEHPEFQLNTFAFIISTLLFLIKRLTL